MCTLLDHLDEHGVFDKASFDAANDKASFLDKSGDGKETIDSQRDTIDNEFGGTNGIDDSVQEEPIENTRSLVQDNSNEKQKGQRH